MIFDVKHETIYKYTSLVVQSQHIVHMSPRDLPRQNVIGHELKIEPQPAAREELTDPFGNRMLILDMEVPHRRFVISALSTIETTPPPKHDWARSTPWDALDRTLLGGIDGPDIDVAQFRCATRLTMPTLEIAEYAAPSFTPGRPVLEATMDLVMRIYREFKFDPTATDISTPIGQVLKQRRGVCQDFAHLSIALLRAQRVPVRYVSGYILTRPPPGQPKMQGTDASHAWISVWAPETGWIDFDPTNGIAVADEHITIACGRDYDDVSPISGVLIGGGDHTVHVGVDVEPRP